MGPYPRSSCATVPVRGASARRGHRRDVHGLRPARRGLGADLAREGPVHAGRPGRSLRVGPGRPPRPAARRAGGAQRRLPRDHGRDQRLAPAQARAHRAAHHRGLSRRAGDPPPRARPRADLRPALRAAGAAGAAPAPARRARAHRSRRRGGHAARRGRRARQDPRAAGRRRRVDCRRVPARLSRGRARGARARADRARGAALLGLALLRDLARAARVRAHEHHGGERGAPAGGGGLHRLPRLSARRGGRARTPADHAEQWRAGPRRSGRCAPCAPRGLGPGRGSGGRHGGRPGRRLPARAHHGHGWHELRSRPRRRRAEAGRAEGGRRQSHPRAELRHPRARRGGRLHRLGRRRRRAARRPAERRRRPGARLLRTRRHRCPPSPTRISSSGG